MVLRFAQMSDVFITDYSKLIDIAKHIPKVDRKIISNEDIVKLYENRGSKRS